MINRSPNNDKRAACNPCFFTLSPSEGPIPERFSISKEMGKFD